eukprot:10056099-Alexandrium_andersonii.AAC.1
MVQAPPAERHAHAERRAQQPTFLQLAGLTTGNAQMPVLLGPAGTPPAPIMLQQPPQNQQA